jgi:hypothetical protein
LGTTETQKKNGCLPDVPPEAITAAAPASEARLANISSLNLIFGKNTLEVNISPGGRQGNCFNW